MTLRVCKAGRKHYCATLFLAYALSLTFNYKLKQLTECNIKLIQLNRSTRFIFHFM